MNSQNNDYTNIDVKIAIDDLTKRVMTPNTFASLQEQVSGLKKRVGLEAEAKHNISYVDSEDEHCIVEDDDDLQMAYAKALSKKKN